MKTYDQFYETVREKLKKYLARFDITDEELDEYLKKEKVEIESGYEDYQTKEGCEHLTDEAAFKSCVSAVAFCLEMCY